MPDLENFTDEIRDLVISKQEGNLTNPKSTQGPEKDVDKEQNASEPLQKYDAAWLNIVNY